MQSTRDVPPFSRAGMDGYAVRAEDTFGASRYEPKTLRVIDKVYTGAGADASGRAGHRGRDRHRRADAARRRCGGDGRGDRDEARQTTCACLTPVYPRQNVGRQGADIVVGQTVIARGDVLNPSRIGALAALGVGDVEVYAKPTVAILSTGNEIADPGRTSCSPGRSTTSTSSR